MQIDGKCCKERGAFSRFCLEVLTARDYPPGKAKGHEVNSVLRLEKNVVKITKYIFLFVKMLCFTIKITLQILQILAVSHMILIL